MKQSQKLEAPKIPDFIGKPAPKGYVAGLSRGARGFVTEASIGKVKETDAKPDEEALGIFEQIDQKMAKKKKRKADESLVAIEKLDIKSNLVDMTMNDWLNIPDAKNISKKKKRKIAERYTPVPDHLVHRPLLHLDESASVVEQEYIAALEEKKLSKTVEDIGDVEKTRNILTSIVQTNKTHAPSWIALARLEEVAKNSSKAKQVILQGCENCTENDDVWLEAARLHSNGKGKSILAQAVRFVPKSESIWLKAAELEDDLDMKKKILAKAVEMLPESKNVWKHLIEMESDDHSALVLLKKAIDVVKDKEEFYLALSKLLPYEESKNLLKKARSSDPSSIKYWIQSAYLEEQNHQMDSIDDIVKNMVALNIKSPKDWTLLAIDCESKAFYNTALKIVDFGFEKSIENTENCLELSQEHGSKLLSKRLTQILVDLSPNIENFEKLFNYCNDDEKLPFLKRISKSTKIEVLWLKYAKSKSAEIAARILRAAIDTNSSPELFIAIVKAYLSLNDFENAKMYATQGMDLYETSPRLKLKKLQICIQERHFQDFEIQMDKCIENFPKFSKFYLLKAEMACHSEKLDDAARILEESIYLVPQSFLHYILLSRIYEKKAKLARSRAILETGRKACPKSVDLWIESCRLEKRNGFTEVAAQVILTALHYFPESGHLMSELIYLEIPLKRKSLIVEALKKCPTSHFAALCTAKYYWSISDAKNAKKWFEKAIELNAEYGDTYIEYYAFAQENASFMAVLEAAKSAKPRYGDLWTAHSKNWQNSSLSDILTAASKLVIKDSILSHVKIVDIFLTLNLAGTKLR
eukprot:NODE_9_length_64580_cov_1.431941.p6 type:complete len:812 gc:universal NODE_9_length_64580_cov_1.431941:10034-12469(+)